MPFTVHDSEAQLVAGDENDDEDNEIENLKKRDFSVFTKIAIYILSILLLLIIALATISQLGWI